jgi:hypothetical protein
MPKRDKSSVLIASNLGRHALVFSEDDVVRLLRAAAEREGGQTAFAKRHDLDRVLINRILNGKRPVRGAIAKALGLRKLYVAEQVGKEQCRNRKCAGRRIASAAHEVSQ